MTQVCTYTVRQDTGLAPNPFWGWCTLALCTPNHQGIELARGDWIAGFLDKEHGNRLLYAMELTEDVLDRDAYFRDQRFAQKKPIWGGSWNRRCGDNMYFREETGWRRISSPFHGPDMLDQDTRYSKVYVSERFIYLGRKAAELPREFQSLLRARGCKKRHAPAIVSAFLKWATSTFHKGMHALPNHCEDRRDRCADKMPRDCALRAPTC